MPKSAKKRKDKAADFAKAKLKLGKGKQTPTNAIDTSFKARSIALPTQSITVEKDEDAPTTKRRQTLDDLLAHLKHHNAGTRKDAVLGLRELFGDHLEVAISSFPVVVNATVRLIGDEDASVRKSLISLYSWLLSRIPAEDIVPHASIFLLYTSSAQTHIFPEIRIDAVRFLNLLLECIPEAVVSGWDTSTNTHGTRILAGYLGILNAGTIYNDVDTPAATSTATVMLTAQSKLVILQSLSTFLRNALVSHTAEINPSQTMDGWFLSPSFTDDDAYAAFDSLLTLNRSANRRVWQQRPEPEDDGFVGYYPLTTRTDSWDLDLELVDAAEGSGGAVAGLVSKLATALHSTLVSILMDCSAAVFSPSNAPPETDLQLMLAVLGITSSLYGWLLEKPEVPPNAVDELTALLNCMAPFFPFTPSGRRDIKVEQSFQEMNIQYSNLASHLALAAQPTPAQTRHRPRTATARSLKKTAKLSDQIEHVREYVLEVLSSSDRPLSLAAYTSLLPTIWALINVGRVESEDSSSDVLLALLQHGTRVSSKSSLKKCSVEFISRLLLLETDSHYRGAFRVPKDDRNVEEWITHLPKVLWELGSTNLPAAEAILLFIIRILQCKLPQVHNPRTLSSIQARLVPYFLITHPERGRISGPYTKLPVFTPSDMCVRRLVLSVSATLLTAVSTPSAELLEGIEGVVGQSPVEEMYWQHLKASLCP
ncbi:rRNA processing protein [Marasmius crinis-equi]|uniref:Pre-rRNA-processing protein n=1 Tax=Marasmius crinis-equi TaxID=585013 RepID=A0ABR3FZT4_9AGAR